MPQEIQFNNKLFLKKMFIKFLKNFTSLILQLQNIVASKIQ